jgi:acyl-lipid omega-6 desaturase (Delta-12 desaturase)
VSNPERGRWRSAVLPYARADTRRAVVDLATSLVPFLALIATMLMLVDTAYPAVVILTVPAAGFMTRTFLVMHDCAHGSFLHSRRANDWLGVAIGVIVLQPFRCWRYDHIRHHASGGDLAADGTGDVDILTVDAFRALSRRQRAIYRLRHDPVVVLGIGGFWANGIKPRLLFAADPPRLRWVKITTNVAVAVMLVAVCRLAGWRTVLLGALPTYWLASVFGVWLIWVQHRFEGAVWQRSPDWDWESAALTGSSHFKLPRVLQFFSLNIGLHHVHHLNPRVPNYKLSRANDELDFLRSVPTVSLLDGIRALRLSLYDLERGRLVSFRDALGKPPPRAAIQNESG